MTEFQQAIYRVLQQMPAGYVINYGRLALLAGYPGHARAVGNALHALDEVRPGLPWWRVINRAGRISTNCSIHTAIEQRRRLEAEGVEFNEQGFVDWARFGWLENFEVRGGGEEQTA